MRFVITFNKVLCMYVCLIISWDVFALRNLVVDVQVFVAKQSHGFCQLSERTAQCELNRNFQTFCYLHRTSNAIGSSGV